MSELVVTPAQFLAIWRVMAKYDRLRDLAPDELAARDAEVRARDADVRAVVGPIPDGDYHLRIDPGHPAKTGRGR